MLVPHGVSYSEHFLDVINVDFKKDRAAAERRQDELHGAWHDSRPCKELVRALSQADASTKGDAPSGSLGCEKLSVARQILTLVRRNNIKNRRDLLSYGTRLGLYAALGVLAATMWLRLEPAQSSIQPLTMHNYFCSAFMSFMTIAYIPAFLEDLRQYIKEQRNGLCDAAPFLFANTLAGIPYVCAFSSVQAALTYWPVHSHPTAEAFFTLILWNCINVWASESLIVLVTIVFPDFIVSLGTYGFLCAVQIGNNGFIMRPGSINSFYKYAVYHWNYHKYIYLGLMANEFEDQTFSCGNECRCAYASPLADQCKIAGGAVLDSYGIPDATLLGRNVGLCLASIFRLRVAAWLVLTLRR